MSNTKLIRETFEKGEGVLRMIPVFVPRRFSKPGRRLKLHPDDYYALGTKRGGIKERWFSSVIPAMNGELAPSDEGMSYVSHLLKELKTSSFSRILLMNWDLKLLEMSLRLSMAHGRCTPNSLTMKHLFSITCI